MAKGLTFDDVIALCDHLPAVEVSSSYGTPALKVKGKLLVRLKEEGDCIVLRVPFVVRDHLVRSQAEVFFITDHYRDYPSVLVRLHKVSRTQLKDLIESAWREFAPKKLVLQFDESGAQVRKGR